MAYFRNKDLNILAAHRVITCEEWDAGLTCVSSIFWASRSAGDRRLTGRQWSGGEESGGKTCLWKRSPGTVCCMGTLNIFL